LSAVFDLCSEFSNRAGIPTRQGDGRKLDIAIGGAHLRGKM